MSKFPTPLNLPLPSIPLRFLKFYTDSKFYTLLTLPSHPRAIAVKHRGDLVCFFSDWTKMPLEKSQGRPSSLRAPVRGSLPPARQPRAGSAGRAGGAGQGGLAGRAGGAGRPGGQADLFREDSKPAQVKLVCKGRRSTTNCTAYSACLRRTEQEKGGDWI